MTRPNTDASVQLWQRRWLGPAAIAAAAIALLIHTWGTWPDALVDFGVQLYVPWQLAQGHVLYRDIAHYTGPLSVYYNAVAFKMLGVSLRTLVLANLPVLGGILSLLYVLTGRMAGRFCATVCVLAVVVLFAFAHLMPAGNYNFVCPYEYEYTHATLLCLGTLWCLDRLISGHKLWYAGCAGFLSGLVFLTRAEFFVAVAAAAGVGLGIFSCIARQKALRAWLYFLGMMLVPMIVSAGLLSLAMPVGAAVRGTLGMWPAILAGNVAEQHFYKHSMGLDNPAQSLWLMGIVAAWYVAAIGVLAAWAMLGRRRPALPQAILAGLLGLFVLAGAWEKIDWISLFRPLPIVGLIVVIMALVRRPIAPLPAMFAVLSLVLLIKVFLYARIEHYGCWLAMPAAMLLLTAIFGWIPAFLRKRGAVVPIYLAGMAGIWLVVFVVHLRITDLELAKLNTELGSDGDAFRADSRQNEGAILGRAVQIAEQIIPPDKTLACFPEGIMINYLSRRGAPTRFVNYNPPDLLLFGEDAMLDALKQTPPDYVMLVYKDMREFGLPYFGGAGYGAKIYAWIGENYAELPVPLDLGGEPMRDGGFGIRVLVRRNAR